MKTMSPLLISIITIFLFNGFAMSANKTPVNSSRLLLAKLRGGDYAHAGDTEAIDMVLQKVLSFNPNLKKEPVLDVGSGFGGTADYLFQHGFQKVQGIDLDQAAVSYATEKYPKIAFKVTNALNLDKIFPP